MSLVIHRSVKAGQTTGPQSKLELALAKARQDQSNREKEILALFNGSGLPRRPLTNLNNDNKFALPKGPKKGLVAFTSLIPKDFRNDQLWAAVITEILAPEHAIAGTRDLQTIKRKRKTLIKELGTSFTAAGAAARTRVRKEEKGFTVVIPVASTKKREADGKWATNFFEAVTMNPAYNAKGQAATGPGLDEDDENSAGVIDTSGGFVPDEPASIEGLTGNVSKLKLSTLGPKFANLLRATGAQITFEEAGGFVIVLATFNVDVLSAEFLCNNSFDDIRTVDMYGLAKAWAQGKRDAGIVPPKSTKPLSDIAATLPQGGVKKTNEDELLIDHLGEMYFVPPKVNNIKVYDSALAIALSTPDGFMTQRGPGEQVSRKLPPSQQVFVDWVNSKWSYVSDSGNLQVMDLSRSQPVNVSHVRKLLASKIVEPDGSNLISSLSAMQGSFGFPRIEGLDFKTFISNMPALIVRATDDLPANTIADIRFYYIAELAKAYDKTGDSDYMPYKQFMKFCARFAEKVMLEDPADLYKDFSVTTISSLAARALILAKYGMEYDEIHLKDRERRAKYTAPDVDPTWKLPALPYLAEGRGLMPHQGKAANMLRDSPDNAVLGVEAGGGKTAAIVTDVLKEMQNGVKGPFLVMCPAHLVAQYVIEFSYFTDSRINTVPVTTYTLKHHGYAGLEAMIDAAPINTVVLADYNLAKGSSKNKSVGYGTSSVTVYPLVEFLRQFHFQYVGLDESHYLKNTNSTQSEAVSQLVNGIPKKRLASGTFMANSPTDIAGQFAMLDPTVFGTAEQFNTTYSESGTPGKIKQFKEGAELEIKRLMKENARMVMIGRKEWAAILPRRIESFDHLVNLSSEQRRIYNMILAESLDAIKEAAKTNERLAIALGLVNVDEGDREEVLNNIEDDTHSSMEGGLDELLRPYLARLESFINAPASDPLGNLELKGEDRLSPKIAELVNIYSDHMAQQIPGKILVFTNQKADAQHIYDNLPEPIKNRTLLYLATDKEAAGSEFENNANYQMMIGVGVSMEVGLNLQFCSRLVRMSAVMSPASLEQGNARIGRPNVKVAETRSATYYDWVICDNSIDQTKVAYLLTKKVRIASVTEAGNPNYRNLEIPELFSLNLETIAGMNTADTLAEYVGEDGMYRTFMMCQAKDYEEFRQNNTHLLDENGKMKLTPLTRSANLQDSKIMRRIPYVPGIKIYGTDELGLVRVDNYLREDAMDIDDEAEDEADEANTDGMDERQTKQANFLASVVGLKVHTDKGEGEVVGGSAQRNRLRVRLLSGEFVNPKTMGAYVITRKQTSGKDIRGHLAKLAGDIPIDTPVDVKDPKSKVVPDTRTTKAIKDTRDAKQGLSITLDLLVSNDFVGLQLDNPDDNKEAAKTLALLKFEHPEPYVFAKLDSPERFLRLAKKMKEAGFTLSKPVAVGLESFYNAWVKMRSNAKSMFGQATSASLKNFYMLRHKANPDKKVITAYIMVENEVVYLCMPMRGFPGNKAFVTKNQVPGVRWLQAPAQLVRYFNSPKDLTSFVGSLISSGISITNEAQLHADVVRLHKTVQRVTKQDANDWYAAE